MSLMSQEHRSAIALCLLTAPDTVRANTLYRRWGSAEAALSHFADDTPRLPLDNTLTPDKAIAEALVRADDILARNDRHHIRTLTPTDPDYPQRMLTRPDAPIALHYLGPADLNAAHTVAVVGTRSCTPEGVERTRALIHDIARQQPGTLIVSGLAYGIDITAHRTALEVGLPTVAVLGHGLQTIYPAAHRDTAVTLTRQGGLITVYPIGTGIERRQFVDRDFIIAQLADTVIVTESHDRGGALITADYAQSIGREAVRADGELSEPTFGAGANVNSLHTPNRAVF